MLELLEKLATKLQPFRKLSYLLASILVGVIFVQLLQAPLQYEQPNDFYAILSFIACIWLLLFNILISIFDNIPSASNNTLGMVARFKIKLQLAFYQLLALLFIGLTLVIIFITIRLLRI